METIIVQGALVNVLGEIAPDIYGPYDSTDKKEVKNIILRCHNAIHGTMLESLLYYKKSVRQSSTLGSRSTHMIHALPTAGSTTTIRLYAGMLMTARLAMSTRR